MGAGGVAGAAQINRARAQAVPARGLQEAANGHPAAGALLADAAGPQGLDGFGGGAVEAAGGLEILVVAEVGADDEAGLGAVPEGIKDLADFLGRGVADRQRDEGEVAQDALQEGQLHFERMLVRVGVVQFPDLG